VAPEPRAAGSHERLWHKRRGARDAEANGHRQSQALLLSLQPHLLLETEALDLHKILPGVVRDHVVCRKGEGTATSFLSQK